MTGEQRGRSNKLQIELGVGNYDVIIQQAPSAIQNELPPHCLEMNFVAYASPLHKTSGLIESGDSGIQQPQSAAGQKEAEILKQDEQVLILLDVIIS